MSECSNYQLLHQTDYVRLIEKYDHLYIYSHYTIMHCPQGIISAIFEAKDYCSVEWSDAIVRQLLSAKQWLTETRRITTATCENSCPVEWSDDCCKTITACETVVDRNSITKDSFTWQPLFAYIFLLCRGQDIYSCLFYFNTIFQV